ncbi:MAG: hypothetical protein H8E12_16765 [Rhodobacteraceae bacterium]|nr:hypothetical protein [Paracoccaceae bacterium]
MVKHLRKKDPALATMLEKQVAVDLKVGKYATDAPLTKKGTAFSLLGFKKGAEAAEKPKKGNQQQKLVGLNVKAISDSTKVLPDSIKTHTAYLDSLQKANTEGAQQDLEQHGG